MKYKVTCNDGEVSFYCAEDEAVLKAMIHAGRGPVKHGCCGGGCGVCKVRIVAGDYHAFKPMSAAHVNEADREQGVVLSCCVQPRSDLVIARV
ncbi:MAG: 2Fe-2S iron-sulfur cluster binding domain-containing protein [Treponema sp.]|jgi:ferredoxin|nr:2Fe-2S iron-sulfur cluster binding domain-containing protein [Treponema sp.]